MGRSLGAAVVFGGLIGGASCATHVFVPPSGAGEPAPDASVAWRQATQSCRGAVTYSAQLHVAGHVGSQSLHRTINGAVTLLDQIRLEVPAPIGRPILVLGGEASEATLVTRDHRQLTARADDIVDALTGLKWSPRHWLAVLTGCASETDVMTSPVRIGAMLVVTSGDARIYLQLRDGAWQVRAALVDGLTIDYRDIEGRWPREIRVDSDPGRTPAIALTIGLDQLDINRVYVPADFVVRVPPDATPMTLEELRAMGPLREGDPR